MPKRKKRGVATKKKKDDNADIDDDDVDEPAVKKVAVSSSTGIPEDDSSQSSFSVEGVNIGKSEKIGGEVGFSSHFWCNYCEYSSDTKKELVTHMRQHMTKCSYCNFSSLSRAEIAKHVKCEHADEAERTICEVDSSSSGMEHDMDKDPCSACIFCDFMTYSTEHLEKHTSSKHKGMLPKSVAKMISKQVSARIRRDDAMFYCAISSDSFDKPMNEGENFFGSKASEFSEAKSPIVIEPEPTKLSVDIKPNISPRSPEENSKADVKPSPQSLSQTEIKDPVTSDHAKDLPKVDEWKVKVETLYCLSCPYSNVAIEKLKCHALTQHPEGVAAASFTSEPSFKLQDITFYCPRESCSHSSVQCYDFEEHLMNCCFPPDSLLFGEKERLKDTIKFIFKCQEKQEAKKSKDFAKFSSQYASLPSWRESPSPPINSSSPFSQTQTESNQNLNSANISGCGSFDSCHSPAMQAPVQANYDSNANNVQQIPSFQANSDIAPNNFNHQAAGQTQSNLPIGQDNLHLNPSTSAKGQTMQSSSIVDSKQEQQMFGNPAMQKEQVVNPAITDNNYQQNLNLPPPPPHSNNLQQNPSSLSNSFNHASSTTMGNQAPAAFDFSTNTVSSGQQNMYPSHPAPNPEPIVAPSFDSQFSVMSGGQHNSQPSFTPQHHQSIQQPQQQQQIYQNMSATDSAATDYKSASSAPNTYPHVQPQPKMLDLLTDANAILLDNDLSIQSWPVNHSDNAMLPQQIAHGQSSLHTPPLPHDASNNPPVYANTNFENSSIQPLPSSSSFPYPGVSSLPTTLSHYSNTDTPLPQQSQLLPTQPALTQPEPVIDLDGPQTYNTTVSSQDTPTLSMNYVIDNGSTHTNPPPHHASQQPETAASVPNFLVPSSSGLSEYVPNNANQPNSFLTNSVPPQLPNQQMHPMDYPSTPPSQKNIPGGTPRFPNGNSPLSPSIYLNGNPPPPSSMAQQFRPSPQQQGMNLNYQQPTSNVRQRLFMRGQQRGPGMQNRMVRPPVNPVDDDVIVTAVVRGPAPQRPPINPRGRGMTPNQRGMGPNQRGMAPNQRGMAPNQRGMTPNQRGMRGMAPRGRGMAPRGRGMAPGGRGFSPNGRGRAGMPIQRGRGGMPRGRGGALPPNMSPQAKKPFDVSRHFVDLACVVNANEEEGDEIQIVGVTPGTVGMGPPKAVDAKKFSYCCIHCGQDQGSKEKMKKHIKSSHCDSLLGAFRNVESGQWLYFCPQLTCEFMTYDESRLTNHLFTCYNLDKTKPLPYDMQSALRNLKSLKIRHVTTQEGASHSSMGNTVNSEGQGLRDAFNSNLKDAFDDMVENTMGRQLVRPNQPPRPPNEHPPANTQPPSSSYTSLRGALRGPYSPRGTPPKNVRQGFPGHGQMPPGYRQRGPMMRGSPRQPRFPSSPGRPRAPGQMGPTRGMAPIRGGPYPMQGPRLMGTRGDFMPRPNLATPGTPGNEQSPIVIDLDMDSPGHMPEDSYNRQESAFASAASTNHNSTPMDISTPPTNVNRHIEPPLSSQAEHSTGIAPFSAAVADNTNTLQTMTNALPQNYQSAVNQASDSVFSSGYQNATHPPHQPLGGNSSSNAVNDANGNCNSAISTQSSADSNNMPNAPSPTPAGTNISPNVPSPTNPVDIQTPALPSQTTALSEVIPSSLASVKDVPSPSQLLAEMNAMSNKPTIPQPPQEQNAEVGAGGDSTPPDNDEELVNTILLDKVFAKVPHMPKKLSQRLVLKFKKYAADRGMIITPTSRVIDEFVSKISYKGSHSAPTPISGQEKPNTDTSQPAQPSAISDTDAVRNNADTATSPNSFSHQPPPNQWADIPAADNQHLSSTSTCASSVSAAASMTHSELSAQVLPSSSLVPTTTDASSHLENSDAAPSDDVIETKVIFAERKLQFKGAFANIIKEKNTQNSTPSPIPPNVSDNYENSLQDTSRNLPPTEILPAIPLSSDPLPSGDNEEHEIARTMKKEVMDPVSFPSVSKEDTIEVKSSVDHIICGHASLEVDIAGKPLSAGAFNSKEDVEGLTEGCQSGGVLSPTSKSLKEKDREKLTSVDISTGTLKFKIKKGLKPRVVYAGTKEDEIVPEKSDDSSNSSLASVEDPCVRRSERKRKAVKLDYNTEELGEMDELMSDEDDEYNVDSDESYNGSDSDSRGKKKVKKTKSVPDPTAFDLSTKGSFGCWKCCKVFSRVMFLKRHILKKHKENGLCAIVLTETGIPNEDQPTLLLFCPQSCKYVTSECDAYGSHLENCSKPPLNVEDQNCKITQESFFKNEVKLLLESIASGTISTKIPVKPTPTPRKKSQASQNHTTGPGPGKDAVNSTSWSVTTTTTSNSVTNVTTATIHPPPSQHPLSFPGIPSHSPHASQPHHPLPVEPSDSDDMSIVDPMMVSEDDGYYYQHNGEMNTMLPADSDPHAFYPEENFYPQ